MSKTMPLKILKSKNSLLIIGVSFLVIPLIIAFLWIFLNLNQKTEYRLPAETAVYIKSKSIDGNNLVLLPTFKKYILIFFPSFNKIESRLKNQFDYSFEKIYRALPPIEEIFFVVNGKNRENNLILVSKKIDSAPSRLDILEKEFITVFTLLFPEKRFLVLPDGTQTAEYIANYKKFSFEEWESGENRKLRFLQFPDSQFGLFYVLNKNRLFLSTKRELLKEILFPETKGDRTRKLYLFDKSCSDADEIILTKFSDAKNFNSD